MAEGPLGLFGGTFDPPHVGHVATAVAVRHALGLREVWLVVANHPWQKEGHGPVTAAADRLALVEAAAEGVDGVVASRIEMDRDGPSYTVDTLRQLRETSPGRTLWVILGGDAAGGLLTWRRPDEVRRLSRLVVVDRPGVPASDPPDGWPFTRVAIPRLDVSSTDLRRRIAAGEPVDGLVPPAVCRLIAERGLYRGPRL